MMTATSDELERICMNCNHAFPSEPFVSDFAICLNDPEFEPYLDDLLENQDFSRCQQLVEQKRFDWEQEACPDFDPAEVVDEDVPFSPELSSAIEKLARDGEKIASRYRRKGIVPNARLKAVFLSHQEAGQGYFEPGERRVARVLVASRISLP